ncbi:MAG TPA: helix-turn-helix transcriptional regulator [Ilumatobacter sp.]|nr:helix-turn-helix transcriptional regulator [Ilumatobacter sp.]
MIRLVDAASTVRSARTLAGLTLRELADRADTSHSALAAYETGRVTPSVDTLTRIARAAGFTIDTALVPARQPTDRLSRGRELVEVLELAGMFPARHATHLEAPVFPRRAEVT